MLKVVMQTAVLAATLLSLLPATVAQISTDCNPLKTKNCPADPALGATFFWDFRNGPSDAFKTDSYWLPYISYDKVNGATFTLPKQGIAPTLSTIFYIMFGKVEVTLKKAVGTGIVSDVILGSDDQDEIDLEWTSWNSAQVQSNYYSLRNKLSYEQGLTYTSSANLESDFHTYSIDWNADRLIFGFDGTSFRTVTSGGNSQYPQTPMKATIGLWAGGDANNGDGTRYWAGGLTDYSKGPFNLTIQSIKITDYSTGSAYSYGDQTGEWPSIRAQDGSVFGHGTAAANPKTVSTYDVPASLAPATSTRASSTSSTPSAVPTDLPVSGPSVGGYCGVGNGSSTCLGTPFGDCCSQYGACGKGADYCGTGCQPSFGNCDGYPSKRLTLGSSTVIASSVTSTRATASATVSPVSGVTNDGTCGSKNGTRTCTGSIWGDCCSQYGWCGDSIYHCGDGCQPAFGDCGGYPYSGASDVGSSTSSTTSPVASPAGSAGSSQGSPVASSGPSTTRAPTSSSTDPASSSSTSSPSSKPAAPAPSATITSVPSSVSPIKVSTTASPLPTQYFGVCPASSNAAWTALNSLVFTQLPCGTDYPGGDITSFEVDSFIQPCAEHCATVSGCKQAVWDYYGGQCYLKSTVATTPGIAGASHVVAFNLVTTGGGSSATSTPTTPQTSTPPAASATPLKSFSCPKQNNTLYLSPKKNAWGLFCDTDFTGGDLGWSQGVDVLDCVGRCEAKSGCAATVWAAWWKVCYYKAGKYGGTGADAINPRRVANAYGAYAMLPSASGSAAGAASATSAAPKVLRRWWKGRDGSGHGHGFGHAQWGR